MDGRSEDGGEGSVQEVKVLGGAERGGDVFDESERCVGEHGGEVLRPRGIYGGQKGDEMRDEDGFPAAPLCEEVAGLGMCEPGVVVGGRLGVE